jgi:hypothetical protein
VNRRSAQIAALAITLAAAQPAIASPIRLSHQGRMLDASGAPIEGEHTVEVQLLSTEGDVLWTDTFPTTFQRGYFHLVLGSERPLDGALFQAAPPRLSLALDGGAPVVAAEPIAHVPYAALAEHARLADRASTADAATQAERAFNADQAVAADRATEAERAVQADRAIEADRATAADHADTATSAEQATRAAHANTADSATRADTATLAQRAETATLAEGFAGDTLNLTRVDAETVAGGHVQSTTALFGTLQAGRVNGVVGLGHGSGLTCDSASRGVLRYPPGGPVQVCSTEGWIEVGATGPGTCSIVGECPGGEEPSRVWFDDLGLRSERAIELFCSRYEQAISSIGIGGYFENPGSIAVPCLSGSAINLNASALPSGAELSLPLFEATLGPFTANGSVIAPSLGSVGAAVALTAGTSTTTLPALTTVGGDLTWTWATDVTDPSPLPDFMPSLETVGGKLLAPHTGPLVPLPNLTYVGGAYTATTVDAPNLREVGGKLTIARTQADFPALEVVHGLHIGNNPPLQPGWPVTLDSFTNLQRIEGDLVVECVRDSQSTVDAWVAAFGRANITGQVRVTGSFGQFGSCGF